MSETERLVVYTSIEGDLLDQVKEMRRALDRTYASLIRQALKHYYKTAFIEVEQMTA